MNAPTDHHRILIINGTYRDDGITDQAAAVAVRALDEAGATVETINLRDYPIEFCLNCRECMQQPGTEPGRCILNDGMQELIDRIEAADAYVLAAPTNLGSVTALFKRFMERLAPYAYWPWSKPYPELRKRRVRPKKALLISSSAAPGWLGRWMFGSSKQLNLAVRSIGAKSIGLLFIGMASQAKDQRLPAKTVARAQVLAKKLLHS